SRGLGGIGGGGPGAPAGRSTGEGRRTRQPGSSATAGRAQLSDRSGRGAGRTGGDRGPGSRQVAGRARAVPAGVPGPVTLDPVVSGRGLSGPVETGKLRPAGRPSWRFGAAGGDGRGSR